MYAVQMCVYCMYLCAVHIACTVLHEYTYVLYIVCVQCVHLHTYVNMPISFLTSSQTHIPCCIPFTVERYLKRLSKLQQVSLHVSSRFVVVVVVYTCTVCPFTYSDMYGTCTIAVYSMLFSVGIICGVHLGLYEDTVH